MINDEYLSQNELLRQENSNLKRRLLVVEEESEVKKAKVVTLSKPFVDLTNDDELDSDVEVIESVPAKSSQVEVSSEDSDVEETPVSSQNQETKPAMPSEDWEKIIQMDALEMAIQA